MSKSTSIVEYFSENSGSSCGYCKGKKSSFSHGLWAHILTPSDYQHMIDRGWRRSGKYCYKPTMNKTCCPQYPIRCNVKEFIPRKSHKKVMKRFRNYIENDSGGMKKKNLSELPPLSNSKLNYNSQSDDSYDDSDDENASEDKQMQLDNDKADKMEEQLKMTETIDPKDLQIDEQGTSTNVRTDDKSEAKTSNNDFKDKTSYDAKQSKVANSISRPSMGPDPNKPPARKAKDIRRERALLKKEKKSAPNSDIEPSIMKKPVSQSLLDQVTDPGSYSKSSHHKFEIRLLNAQTSDKKFMESFEESFLIYRKYQVAIHKDKPEKCTANQYTRFLCNSSLVPGGGGSANNNLANIAYPDGYGAYHQQYLVDGKIICVGVLDILPHCVSSVYFYYDPDYSFLSLGTLSSLFEISYVRKLSTSWDPKLYYYYMGFYIHSCPKMRYKSQYHPSFLLCPETYSWFDVNKCTPKLDFSKYSRFNEDVSIENANTRSLSVSDLNSVLVLHKHERMYYGMLAEFRKLSAIRNQRPGDDGLEDHKEVAEYATLTGIDLARKMMLYRS